jgi:hypothetical protein
MRTRSWTPVTVVAVAGALVAGCGSDNEEQEPSSAATATPAAELPAETPEPAPPKGSVPPAARGTYVMRSEKSDGLPFAGEWTLKLGARRWSEAGPHGERNTGKISGDQERLAFLDDGECGDEPGVYGYQLSGGVLELRPEDSDPCSGREIKLTWSSDPWHRR